LDCQNAIQNWSGGLSVFSASSLCCVPEPVGRLRDQALQFSRPFYEVEKTRLGNNISRTLVMLHFGQHTKRAQSMPPHHPIFGHLLLANDLLSKLPRGAHPSYLPGLIRRAIPDVGQVFYLDMWPFSRPILVVSSPSVAQQFTQERSLRKSPEVHTWLKPLANNQDLVSLEGQGWKQWRNVYNPGFSASHLIHLVPQIAAEVSTFCDILSERVRSGAILPLEEATVNLTMDTIGRIVL
jgi:hypothetical protein